MHVVLDGQLVPLADAAIPVTDRGFLYGDAAFETIAVRAGRPFRLGAHLDRLADSLRALRFAQLPERARLADDTARVIDTNRLDDGLVRLAVTRGSGPRGPRPCGVGQPTVLISPHPRPAAPAPAAGCGADGGVALAVSALRRVPAACLPAHAKHANFLSGVLALAEAGEGVYDTVLLTIDEQIAECAFSNIFFVRGGRLHTPALALGILPGITRAAVIELARARRLGVVEGAFDLVELASADEVFVTNTGAGVVPVAWLAATRFPAPGPIATLLRADYERLVRDETAASTERRPPEPPSPEPSPQP